MDTRILLLRHFLCFLFLLDFGATSGVPDLRSPCMGCILFNDRHIVPKHKREHPFCKWPCYCPPKPLECQAGVSVVKDGCGCCNMCARQYGAVCSVRDKCDTAKKLFCNNTDDNSTGTCVGKSMKGCVIQGAVYKHGEKFYLGCTKICTCQNGYLGCAPQCPEERYKPSEITCHDAKLVKVPDKCCREWVCQKMDSVGHLRSSDVGLESGNLVVNTSMWYSTPSPQHAPPTPTTVISLGPQYDYSRMSCDGHKDHWSPCSITCGVGVSFRSIVDKVTCQTRKQQRLCYLRPCNVKVENYNKEGRCTPTSKTSTKQQIRYQDCLSVRKYRPKHCTTCSEGKCCYPKFVKHKMIKFQCMGGSIQKFQFMWIRKCQCKDKCYNLRSNHLTSEEKIDERKRMKRWRKERRKKKKMRRSRRRQKRIKKRERRWRRDKG